MTCRSTGCGIHVGTWQKTTEPRSRARCCAAEMCSTTPWCVNFWQRASSVSSRRSIGRALRMPSPSGGRVRGADVVMATSSRSRKVRNLERDTRATLVLHDSRPGAEVCGASLRGRAEIVRGAAAGALVELVHLHYVTPAGLDAARGPGVPRLRRCRPGLPARRCVDLGRARQSCRCGAPRLRRGAPTRPDEPSHHGSGMMRR